MRFREKIQKFLIVDNQQNDVDYEHFKQQIININYLQQINDSKYMIKLINNI